MGVESLNNGARFQGAADHLEARRDQRREEAREGESALAKTHSDSQRGAVVQRDSFQKARTLAQRAQLLAEGRQHAADQRTDQAKAAETPQPNEAHPPAQESQSVNQPQTTQETLPSNPPNHSEPVPQEAQPSVAENLPQPETASQPAAAPEAPAVPNAPSEPQTAQQSQNQSQSQGEGQSGSANQPQTRLPRSTPESGETPSTSLRTSSDEAHLTPEQKQQLQYARLQGGGQLTQPRTPNAAGPTSGTPVAPDATPVPMAPETPAQQAPARSVILCSAPHLTEEQQPAYAEGLRCMYELAHMEQPRMQGPQASPMAAAVFQAAAPAMTREQMLMARLTRDQSRGRDGEGGRVSGTSQGTSGLTRDYMIGARRDMGAA